VFVNNVADEHPVVSGGTTNPLIGVTSVYYGPPRMVGFRLRYAFGSEAR
jgi:outer membrane receptor protein involved in Fe transport